MFFLYLLLGNIRCGNVQRYHVVRMVGPCDKFTSMKPATGGRAPTAQTLAKKAPDGEHRTMSFVLTLCAPLTLNPHPRYRPLPLSW